MNIYVTETLPNHCAESLCDFHITRCSTDYLRFLERVKDKDPDDYAVWLRKDLSHYLWMLEFAIQVWEESVHRFGGNSVTLEPDFITRRQRLLNQDPSYLNLPSVHSVPMPPPQHLPKQFQLEEPHPQKPRWSTVIAAYRQAYVHFCWSQKWTRREPPKWYTLMRKQERIRLSMPVDEKGRKTFKKITLDRPVVV